MKETGGTKLAIVNKQKINVQGTVMESQFTNAAVFYITFTQDFGQRPVLCCSLCFFAGTRRNIKYIGEIGSTFEQVDVKAADAVSDFDDAGVDKITTQEYDFNETEVERIFITPSQKLTILSAQILADYLYFNGNTEMCKNDIDALYCYYCYCSVFGCINPCYICLPKQQ
jgi:hypothetical protein